MGHIDTYVGILRRLIAKGDPNGIPLAERAINEYWDSTLPRAVYSQFPRWSVCLSLFEQTGQIRNRVDIDGIIGHAIIRG